MARKNELTTSDFLPYEEFKKLVLCLRKDREYMWELYAIMSFSSACRVSDVRKMHWREILNRSSVTITEKKTGKTREVYFNQYVQNAVKELYVLLGCPNKNSAVFANPKTGSPITIQYINKKLKEFKSKYDIQVEHFSTHSFRKGFGRYVYEQNDKNPNSLILLNKILNHSSISITKTYIGITKDEIREVFESIRI